MKHKLLSMGFLALMSFNVKSQIVIDTVSVGNQYANHKFYSLKNDEQGPGAAKDNWDIGFETTGYAAAIIANTQRTNFAVYKAPYSIANYGTLDTTGITNWPSLHNSDQTWDIGAFNRGANPNNANDLGWGIYDSNTHYITGDSCYVVKINATSYKKLKLISLISGVYTFEYANINGAASQTATINKASYAGKNFAYYDLTANAALDREPVSSTWDLMFGRYVAFVAMGPSGVVPYGVAGVLANKGVTVLQVNNDPTPATTNASAFPLSSFSSNISTIGHDWKSVNINTNMWTVTGDTLFFIKDKKGDIWKVRFTGFSGSGTGSYIFSKEQMIVTGINDVKGNAVTKFSVYPNPSTGGNTTLLFSSEQNVSDVSVSVVDLNGRVISTEMISIENGFNQHTLNTSDLTSGVYFININAGGNNSTQKLIKQ